ncbi:hypothetical protein SLE2022_090460 [Rubroshorea leprosula]
MTDSMASLVSSLSHSFREVPPAAIPPMLDCLLASTGLSPSSVFSALFDNFPNLIQAAKKDGKLNSDHCTGIVSMIGALCYLLEKMGANQEALQSFIWKGFIPLMTMGPEFDPEFLNQIADLFFDIVAKTNSWEVLEASLVPFFLSSLRISAGAIEKEELDATEWGVKVNNLNMVDKDHDISPSGAFPLPLSCHVLSLILDAALQSLQAAPAPELVNGCWHAEKCAANLLWDICSMTKKLLLQSLEHRSCAIGFLLPIIFKAFIANYSFEISIHGNPHIFTRNSFFKEIWACCRALFSLGSLERRDAYGVLSLYLSFFSCSEISGKCYMSDGEEFDIKTEKEFWNEIKRGLVNKEGLVRKQSLHILKRVLCASGGSQYNSGFSEDKLQRKHPGHGMTKRELWADKEAKSLGVGKLCSVAESGFNSRQQWEAFLLLYEMLDEYGTHLVDAAWNHQITLLLQFSLSHDNFVSAISRGPQQTQMETFNEVFSWLSILWERGFCHDNPQVRCMIMHSFLGIEWIKYGACAKSIPESFVLGPFMEALNDPVHHSDFGVRGVYSSKAIESAAQFLLHYASYLDARRWIAFLINLASLAKRQSFGRAGLMGLAECIASAACGIRKDDTYDADSYKDASLDKAPQESSPERSFLDNKIELLEVLRFIIQSSKQHFNPNYRVQVCGKVLEAAASLMYATDVPLEILLSFISTLPREFTDNGGSLKVGVQDWLLGNRKNHAANCYGIEAQLLKNLHDFPKKFVNHQYLVENFDDEDLEAWELQAKRWARVLFLVIEEKDDLMPILLFIQNYGLNICKQKNDMEWLPVKFNILILSLVQEIQVIQQCSTKCSNRVDLLEAMEQSSIAEISAIYKLFADHFLFILDEMVSFANLSCSIFWSNSAMENTVLPSSVRGRLGGPSQRRLSNSMTTAVLQTVTSIKAVATMSLLCAQCQSDILLNSLTFLWKFFWKATASPTCDSETEAEVHIAAYEALAHVLKALVPAFSAQALNLVKDNYESVPPPIKDQALLDTLILSFLQNVNDLLGVGVMARTRRAILLKWKWLCIESLLSIPFYAFENGVHLEDGSFFFSDVAIRNILIDTVESLENAGEDSALPMLRAVRLALELLSSGRLYSAVSSYSGVGTQDKQMIWQLVHSCWILHVSCNKRRVAPIAALLSSVLHPSLLSDDNMHMMNGESGPLKWFVEKLLQEGTKSPRTIRLASLHLTGLWFSNPRTIKYYIKELKLLTLYGSVAFDEDFEAELTENHDVRTEVSLLAKSPDPELTEAFINTELYARVSVAVLFNKLADLADLRESSCENKDCQAALESGKLFLLELLDSVVNEKDLAKELYKKYSAIHRRKVRAWQMICVLSRFIDDNVVGKVAESLHIALYRNNLPSVRQYLETFAINIYLKFPALVAEQLVPMLRDYDMRPQALSSYVFIAANVILHASKAVQVSHLDELFPPIIPLLTSHHHSLRGFTQVLVHQVLCRLFYPLDSTSSEIKHLEKRCFEDLKSYLAKNSDCVRLRASMEGYLDAYNPNTSATPSGMFVSRVEEEMEFECVPTSLMEQVLNFLNDVREDLRCSMAKDIVAIKNESLIGEDPNSTEILSAAKKEKLLELPKDARLDFQKKITLSKHEKQDSHSVLGNRGAYKRLLEMEKEDDLLNELLKSRSLAMEMVMGNHQQFILVASFIDRIPNLAGLARTCEVFRASGLAIADTKIVADKQFQLISVTAEKWVPIIEVPVNSVKHFLEKKKWEGFSILGLEQTANSIPLDQYIYPKKTVLVLGREKEGIPVDIIHILDACIEIPQLGVVRSLNVHVSGAIALWEYTRQQRSQ